MFSKHKYYFLIAIFGALLYSSTAFFGFSYLDDYNLIVENQAIINDWRNVGRVFTDDAFFSEQNFYYRPLLNLSFMLESQFVGASPWLYHITNTGLHIAAALLLFAVLIRLGTSQRRSFWLTLFFLAHPALVQAVAWIPGRNDLLLAVFALASFLFFLRYLSEKKLFNYFLSLGFFLFSLLTKEVAIILPFLFAFYYLLFTPTSPTPASSSLASASRPLSLLEKSFFISGSAAAVFFWFMLRQLAIDGDLGGWLQAFFSVIENSPALIIGLGKFFFPFNLAIMPVMKDTTIIYGLVGIILIAVAAATRRIKKGWLVFGLLWFILFMLPSFLNPNPAEFYYLLLLEHRLYLPFIGLIFIFKDLLLPTTKFKLGKRNFSVSQTAAFLILIIFVILSCRHLPNFRNQLTFWNFAVEKSPNSPLAHRNLGAMLYFDGQLDEAEASYWRALELNPIEPMARNNIGVVYRDRGDYEAAESEFKQEMELKNSASYYLAESNLEYLYILQNQLR